jgi:hypothetical protein
MADGEKSEGELGETPWESIRNVGSAEHGFFPFGSGVFEEENLKKKSEKKSEKKLKKKNLKKKF